MFSKEEIKRLEEKQSELEEGLNKLTIKDLLVTMLSYQVIYSNAIADKMQDTILKLVEKLEKKDN